MSKIRVGIYGGTFNPPHIGHICAASKFCSQMLLDRLIIIPSFIPPHKEYKSAVTCNERLEMCKIAFSGMEKTEISDIEIKRGGRSYTHLTLEELSGEDIDLYLLCGTDMYVSLDTWKNPEKIFSLAKICYIRRENDIENIELIDSKTNHYVKEYSAEIFAINTNVIEVSSTEIRENIKENYRFLTDELIKYIIQRELYK